MNPFRFFKWVFVGWFLFSFATCQQVDPPVFDNPYDPENPNFQYPKATITNPANGQILDETSVTLSWVGIFSKSSFSFKLGGRDDEYSAWKAGTSITYSYLDEGSYTFYVREKAGNFEQTEPTSLTFTVNALQQTSLLLTHWYNRAPANTESFVDVWIEEVSLFKGITTQIQTDENITVTQIEKNSGQMEGEGVLLLQITNSLYEINHNHVLMLDGILLGSTNGFTGSAPICRIYFKAIGDGELKYISDSTQIRDVTNQPIEVITFRDGIIEIY
ncbi:MAG: triple tyrosine motif-containing protein [Salinivirgaceae bacterium]